MAKELDLRKFYTFGFSLLQLMLILGTFGLVAVAAFEYLK